MAAGPRFSLMSLMLFAALLCVSVAHWRLRQEHSAITLDRERLRDELGYLAVYNAEMAYVREGHAYEPLTWKYRVYLPDGEYWLYTKEGTIPKPSSSGQPTGSTGPLAGGLFTLTISFRKHDQRWHMGLSAETVGTSKPLTDEVGDWGQQAS